ncbi:MAG: hypothetical protein ACOX50_02225 [Patescibacteria group bacterium]|jgi:hypothetical protein
MISHERETSQYQEAVDRFAGRAEALLFLEKKLAEVSLKAQVAQKRAWGTGINFGELDIPTRQSLLETYSTAQELRAQVYDDGELLDVLAKRGYAVANFKHATGNARAPYVFAMSVIESCLERGGSNLDVIFQRYAPYLDPAFPNHFGMNLRNFCRETGIDIQDKEGMADPVEAFRFTASLIKARSWSPRSREFQTEVSLEMPELPGQIEVAGAPDQVYIALYEIWSNAAKAVHKMRRKYPVSKGLIYGQVLLAFGHIDMLVSDNGFGINIEAALSSARNNGVAIPSCLLAINGPLTDEQKNALINILTCRGISGFKEERVMGTGVGLAVTRGIVEGICGGSLLLDTHSILGGAKIGARLPFKQRQ